MKLTTLSLIALLTLSACGNTLDGAGRDISNMGDKISETF
jgi:predicted small secreted protein